MTDEVLVERIAAILYEDEFQTLPWFWRHARPDRKWRWLDRAQLILNALRDAMPSEEEK